MASIRYHILAMIDLIVMFFFEDFAYIFGLEEYVKNVSLLTVLILIVIYVFYFRDIVNKSKE